MDIDLDQPFDPSPEVSDAVMLRRLLIGGHAGFDQLIKLIGNGAKALRAVREESKFIRANPNLPRGSAFAAIVRGYLIANKLEWTQDNLQMAVASYYSQELEAKS